MLDLAIDLWLDQVTRVIRSSTRAPTWNDKVFLTVFKNKDDVLVELFQRTIVNRTTFVGSASIPVQSIKEASEGWYQVCNAHLSAVILI